MVYYSCLLLYFLQNHLMMINYANRYRSLSALIRRIYDDLVAKRKSKRETYVKRYLDQINFLKRRLYLNRSFQILGAVSFFVNLKTIFSGVQLISDIHHPNMVNIFISFFMSALLFFLI